MNDHDVLTVLYAELRDTMPSLPSLVSDADARMTWLAHVAQVVQAMPTPTQQWACLTDLADLLVTTRYPGMPIMTAYHWLARECRLEHVLAQAREEQLRQAMHEGLDTRS